MTFCSFLFLSLPLSHTAPLNGAMVYVVGSLNEVLRPLRAFIANGKVHGDWEKGKKVNELFVCLFVWFFLLCVEWQR